MFLCSTSLTPSLILHLLSIVDGEIMGKQWGWHEYKSKDERSARGGTRKRPWLQEIGGVDARFCSKASFFRNLNILEVKKLFFVFMFGVFFVSLRNNQIN